MPLLDSNGVRLTQFKWGVAALLALAVSVGSVLLPRNPQIQHGADGAMRSVRTSIELPLADPNPDHRGADSAAADEINAATQTSRANSAETASRGARDALVGPAPPPLPVLPHIVTGERKRAGATASCPDNLESLAASVYFRTDSTVVNRVDRERLAKLGRCLQGGRVLVTGFADGRQSGDYNLALSTRRSLAVTDIIRRNALQAVTITTDAAGAVDGAGQGAPRQLQRESRRVEIQLHPR